MAKIGLFFGSFNPVHIGHLMIANYFYTETDLDEIWIIITPQNPWKKNDELIADEHRIKMVSIAIDNCNWLKHSDFEKELPQPNYTYLSLAYLRKTYPQNEFVLIIGGDNCERFHQWKNHDEILQHHEVWAFPRHSDESNEEILPEIKTYQAPKFEIAAKDIRTALKQGKDMRYFLPNGVYDYIKTHKIF